MTVLYVGTATYDFARPKDRWTGLIAEKCCTLTELIYTESVPEDMVNLLESADAIIISSENSLFACVRWKKIGVA